jgi:hypothetical protein
MEKLNNKFKQYGLILLQDFKRTKALNDDEAGPILQIAYPPPHNVIQDLEGPEYDMHSDNRQDHHKSDNGQRRNNDNNSKKVKGSQRSNKVRSSFYRVQSRFRTIE